MSTALRVSRDCLQEWTPGASLPREKLAEELAAEGGEVDLLIRTGGEKRLSDFLLWECAYAELWFTDRMWPDLEPSDLDAAVAEFRQRERRFGGVPMASAAVPA
jgi:undecaprenyl diphosphate synthase